MIKALIFDFDGTIADTLQLAVEMYNLVAPEYGCKPVAADDLETVRGSKPKDLMRQYGVTKLQVPFLLHAIRTQIKERMTQVKPIDGVTDVLQKLAAQKVTFGILSSNSKENVLAFLRAHHLETYFLFIVSSRHIFGKHRALKKIVRDMELAPADVVYIGDEIRDVEAAKDAGLISAAVTWGFQTHAALAAASPDHLIDTPEDILDLVK